MDKILTLIIPTYNMELYLRYCLDSLLVDEGMDALEVLVVNDGSRDCSLEIAREYEHKYPQTFKVIDKENGNYGSCVNRGLKEATGKYVKVLDADDSFDTEHFGRFIVRFVQCFVIKTGGDVLDLLVDIYPYVVGVAQFDKRTSMAECHRHGEKR